MGRIAFLLVMIAVASSALGADRVGAEIEPEGQTRLVAVKNVCAWPNLTLGRDGSIYAIIHNQPYHGQAEGDVDCWASADGRTWEKRGAVTRHEPGTIRMNHAAGLAGDGGLVVLCSGWTDHRQPGRPKQPKFRDAILRPWVMHSTDGGRTWSKSEVFPAPAPDWSEYIPFGDIWAGTDGALHVSCYQKSTLEELQATDKRRYRSTHFLSLDDGRTWRVGSTIGRSHNETDILPLGGTRWMAVARDERAGGVDQIESEDDGASWGEPRRVTAKGELNGHLARLRDGRLLLSYGVRIDGERGVRARLSDDGGKTWGDVFRLARTEGSNDCGYPSSVERGDGAVVTAWYSKKSPEHDGYHMGVTIWKPPAPSRRPAGVPVNPVEFRRAGIVDSWTAYLGRLTFGRGQTLALVDDGCKLDMPEWTAVNDGVPKVRVARDAVDGDDDPKHEGRGYHGSTIGVPSSLNHAGKLGVAYNNQVAVVRGLECCHCDVSDGKPLARALRWVVENREKHRITTVNLAPVDDKEHAAPVPTDIDAPLAELRRLGVWVSAPTGNHRFTKGISWPASQPNCFAIGATLPDSDVVHLDRGEKVDLVVPASATSSSNAIACGAAMILREAIENTGFDWRTEGANLPVAMMNLFRKTGTAARDPETNRVYPRLDLKAALDHVYERSRK